MKLIDGTGHGYGLRVDETNHAHVRSVSQSAQSYVSLANGEAYQAIGVATLASGTTTGLYVKNTSADQSLIFTFIRHQIIGATGGTAFPNASNYFHISTGRSYDSGGSVATPVNVHIGQSFEAAAEVYDSAPVLTGTAIDIDRWYTQTDGDMSVFNKSGALILAPGQSLEFSYTGDHTAGTLYVRASFVFVNSGLA